MKKENEVMDLVAYDREDNDMVSLSKDDIYIMENEVEDSQNPIEDQDLEAIANLYLSAKKRGIIFGSGVTQHAYGTELGFDRRRHHRHRRRKHLGRGSLRRQFLRRLQSGSRRQIRQKRQIRAQLRRRAVCLPARHRRR